MIANASRGDRVLLLVGPQVVLGAVLVVFPDTAAPRLAQVLVLLHVASAIASVLAFGVWLAFHVRGRFARPPAAERGRAPWRHLVRLSLVATVVGAYATGAAAAWRGEGTSAGDWHALAGLLCTVPLALHLTLDGRGWMRALAGAFIALAPLTIPTVRGLIRPARHPVATANPEPHTVDIALYDRAEWCGSCHTGQFDEWQHSLHARALSNPTVREHFDRTMREEGKPIVDTDLDEPSNGKGFACIQCHAPPTFYGRDKRPVLEDVMLSTQGISCSFCHTVRGRGRDRLYVSAPDTVDRYLGQGSPVVFMREIGDLLIRWRPETHRRDYHVAFLDRSEFCAACHAESYDSWRASRYGPGTSGEERVSGLVECQDCHMAREPRAAVVVEPGKLVPWGEVRPQRRFHGWPGGNARAAGVFHDPEALRVDRALRPGMVTLRVTEVRRDAGVVRATVVLRNDKVGHMFPSGEGGDVRFPYLELQVLDASGNALGTTRRPRERNETQDETDGFSVALIHQTDQNDTPAAQDRRVGPGRELAFHLALQDRSGAARVRARLRSAFDPEPLISADAPL